VIAQAPLPWPKDEVVMDSIPDEHLRFAAIHQHRYAHHHTALWQLQPLQDVVLEAQTLGYQIELAYGHLVRIGIHLVLHRWYRHTLSPPVHMLDTCPSVGSVAVASWPYTQRFITPDEASTSLLFYSTKLGVQLRLLRVWVCVAWIFRVCYSTGRSPSSGKSLYGGCLRPWASQWSSDLPLRSLDDVRGASGGPGRCPAVRGQPSASRWS
jgi:hypothetical protein